ncbi:hypothetical protein HNY73_003259 [Argiope bruennichi]|uniref:Uncharacterized protein n=1 Tax=Argiope bruennichi TaxID=94029 RepID=A0A8T0FYX8_ARGBR|nr:hypothetical protein HNY73_003259 [Argiope bruennichi]
MDIGEYWFMQDDAPQHRTARVFDISTVYLEQELSLINIQNRCPRTLYWSTYSPDRNPCDFYLRDHVRGFVYKKKPTDLISLKGSIIHSSAIIKKKALEIVTDNFVTRLCHYITYEGSHFKASCIKFLSSLLFSDKKNVFIKNFF